MPFDGLAKTSPPGPPEDRDPCEDGRPRRKLSFFMPDMRFIERQTREVWRDMYTIRYEVMNLWDPGYMTVTERDDPETVRRLQSAGLPIIRVAGVGTPDYEEWLRQWHPPGEILPHIEWGGVVKAIPGGDGGKGYAAWKLHALTLR